MTLTCERCDTEWPPHLLRTVPLDGCPECRPAAWRAFGSDDSPQQPLARDGTKSD